MRASLQHRRDESVDVRFLEVFGGIVLLVILVALLVQIPLAAWLFVAIILILGVILR
jgi:Flp pilus assembly protein TadB